MNDILAPGSGSFNINSPKNTVYILANTQRNVIINLKKSANSASAEKRTTWLCTPGGLPVQITCIQASLSPFLLHHHITPNTLIKQKQKSSMCKAASGNQLQCKVSSMNAECQVSE
jgi:hypothetical protein